ncbi:GNAT family N-acetyltransferase [Aurantibacter sp.]|uniref:GNAT family N-acetyltransferase n=1 Tax=Aurantibacter sp. TaxID=2807103 RepID=UPI003264C367
MSNSLQKNEITIRPMLIEDMDSIMQLKNAEQWNQTELDWSLLINLNPKHCFVACYKNKILGTVTAMIYGNKLAWIGMMLVSKDYRGLGIGKLLMNTIIESLKSITSIKLDATLAGIPVYKKLGFKTTQEVLRMTSTLLLSLKEAPLYDTTLQPITKNNINEIAEFDKKAYGVNRLALFMQLLKQENTNNWCLRKKGEITGFILGRNGSKYYQIGPLIAQSTSDSKILLGKTLINLSGKPILVDVFQEETEFVEWLITIGFEIQRSFTRMYLKSNINHTSQKTQYLIAGPELS